MCLAQLFILSPVLRLIIFLRAIEENGKGRGYNVKHGVQCDAGFGIENRSMVTFLACVSPVMTHAHQNADCSSLVACLAC